MAEMDSGILYIDSPEILFSTCQWAYPIGFYSMPKTLSNAINVFANNNSGRISHLGYRRE